MNEVSDNAKAILLLTAPLIVSKKAEPAKILSLREYNAIARSLHSFGLQPQDLLGLELATILTKLASNMDRLRLEALLNRGFLLGQALAEWRKRSIWIVSRADSSYPTLLKKRLRDQAPAVLYGCGDPSLLERGGLAVVGSRKISEELQSYTEEIGSLAAEANVSIVSGAARGIDSSAMEGSLMNGGIVVGVMADSLGRAALAKSNREALQEGRLVLISAYDPAAGFNVGNAMQRNKAIYALADAGLVVTSDLNKGGTWAGAIEQLEKYHFAPVFVRNGSDCGAGNDVLLQRGGKRWPEPKTGDELLAVISSAKVEIKERFSQDTLGFKLREGEADYGETSKVCEEPPVSNLPSAKEATAANPAEDLMRAVAGIIEEMLDDPMTGDEVATALNVLKPQANAWLKELVKSGMIEKLLKPVRYQATKGKGRLL